MIQNTRKCILTNEKKEKSELIRIARKKDNTYYVDSSTSGRGVYISKNVLDPEIIVKKRVLNRAFKTIVPNSVYDELIAKLKEAKNE